jgi:hypothetical protein
MVKNQVTQFSSMPRNRADETVQVRVRRRCFIGGLGGGTVFWTTPAKAAVFVQQRAVDVLATLDGVVPPVAKVEQDPAYPKSSDARTPGPQTDSASSTEGGSAAPLSASGEDQASLLNSATTSDAPASEASAESSQSTTLTSAARLPMSSTSLTRSGGRGTRTGRGTKRSRG